MNKFFRIVVIVLVVLMIIVGLYFAAVVTIPKIGNAHVSMHQMLTRRKAMSDDIKIIINDPEFNWLKPIKCLKYINGPKNVISYSLWGKLPMYIQGAMKNMESIANVYGKDWKARFYIDDTVPKENIDILLNSGICDVYLMPTHIESNGMFWRFLVFNDPNVEIGIIRDADSRISRREYLAVLEWMTTCDQYHVHSINDVMSTRYIMGGSWGAVASKLRNIEELICEWRPNFQYGDDEDFVSNVIFKIFYPNRILSHDSKSWRRANKTWTVMDFPIDRQDDEPSICGRVYV